MLGPIRMVALLKTITEREQVIVTSDKFVGTFVQLAQSTSGGESLTFGGVTAAAGSVDQAMFSVAFVRQADQVGELSRAVARVSSRGFPSLAG